MGPGRGLAKPDHQQQTGKPHRMPTSACASPGKAEGGTSRPSPRKKKQQGGGARERPTATTPPTNTTRGGQTPHPDGTEDRTPKRGAGGPTSQNPQHQAKGSGPLREGTPKTCGHTPRKKKNPQTPNNAAQKRRDGVTETTRPKTGTTSDRHQKKQNQRGWGGAHCSNGNTQTPPHHGRPPRKGRGKRGTRMTAHTPQQHLPKERRGAAETRTPTHTPTPHTRTGNGEEQEEHAHSQARPKTLPRTGAVQAETQPQPQTPRTPAGKGGAKPQTVPKHTHPRPQPGLAGLPKPKPKHNLDPSTNTTQQ